MDKYSFLNAAHTSFFADMYNKYLSHPDSVEPSWRAFFQGFDFGEICDSITLDGFHLGDRLLPGRLACSDGLLKLGNPSMSFGSDGSGDGTGTMDPSRLSSFSNAIGNRMATFDV